jgi:hypothetical protein
MFKEIYLWIILPLKSTLTFCYLVNQSLAKLNKEILRVLQDIIHTKCHLIMVTRLCTRYE